MKYARLTKEQFEELHIEFAQFLASQSIAAKEWAEIKKEKPKAAEEVLDVFSDMVWEGTLSNVTYLENWSENQLYLFFFKENQIELIAIKINNPQIDFTTENGIKWLEKNIGDDQVTLYQATKAYTLEPKEELFNFIKQGAIITQGVFFNTVKKLL